MYSSFGPMSHERSNSSYGGDSNTILRLPLYHHEGSFRPMEVVPMPWKESIQPSSSLIYMPFWEWQFDFMTKELTNLRAIPVEEKFSYNENADKQARIVNMCFRSEEYYKIRMSYYDAGDVCQVFSSLWYPDTKYNLPILGVSMFAFGRNKYLICIDFQPIHDQEEKHAVLFQRMLAPVKEFYPSLKGKMSSKVYGDSSIFFSNQMLYGRFENESFLKEEHVLDAFQKYAQMHVQLVRDCPENAVAQDEVLARYAAFDTYFAEREAVGGVLTAVFGKQWVNEYVHNFLFPMSIVKVEEPSSSHAFGNTNATSLHIFANIIASNS